HHTVHQKDREDQPGIDKDPDNDRYSSSHSQESELDTHPQHVLPGLPENLSHQALGDHLCIQPVRLEHSIDQDAEHHIHRLHMPEDPYGDTDDAPVHKGFDMLHQSRV